MQVSTTPCALFSHLMAGSSDAMLGDIFEKLVDLRQQQDASIHNIERLRDEHKSWQAGRWFVKGHAEQSCIGKFIEK